MLKDRKNDQGRENESNKRNESRHSLWILIVLFELFQNFISFEDRYLLNLSLQVELVLLCVISPFLKREILCVLGVYFLWIVVSDNIGISFYEEWILIEVVCLACLLTWLHKRPERIPSDPPSNTVQMAFYYGIKAPLIAKIISIFNLPFYGIAIVIGDDVMMPSGKSKCIKKVTRRHLNSWTILDTKIPVDDDILRSFKGLEGASVGKADCMEVVGEFLNKLGYDYKPSVDPSSYMAKILSLRV